MHFKHVAPEPKEYGVNRYMFEAERHWGIIDAHLAANKFMLGDKYTFVDMALWGWTRALPYFFGPEGFAKFPHLKKWFDGVNARPAVARAEALKDKHAFKMENDAQARAAMFPHLAKVA